MLRRLEDAKDARRKDLVAGPQVRGGGSAGKVGLVEALGSGSFWI